MQDVYLIYSTVSGANDFLDGRTNLFVSVYYVLASLDNLLGLLATICFICNKKRLLWLSVLLSATLVVIAGAGAFLLEWLSGGPGAELLRMVLFLLYTKKVCRLLFFLYALRVAVFVQFTRSKAGNATVAVELAETKSIEEVAQMDVGDVQKVGKQRENENSLSLSARDALGDDSSAVDEQGRGTESNNSEKDGRRGGRAILEL